eukprot:CAMPEP_0168509064 /NCGR_PEP_ID=MMETSP0405-20121227/532_1 /TAXON_ID=498012 /ORGANISM="Trichosphaerium sp, Strain Am-I-7 wt" /LENGTH=105 /DNA_ID=CAMNT_0008526409 /DNA_START=1085 /DNA_END=1402 /DNA_ORIENTATION=+
MAVVHVKTEEEYATLAASGKVIIDYSATWCGPCKKIAPVYEELATKNPDVKFLHVDIDELGKLEAVKKVRGVPTFVFLNNGEQVSTFSGANSKKLEDSLNDLKKA